MVTAEAPVGTQHPFVTKNIRKRKVVKGISGNPTATITASGERQRLPVNREWGLASTPTACTEHYAGCPSHVLAQKKEIASRLESDPVTADDRMYRKPQKNYLKNE